MAKEDAAAFSLSLAITPPPPFFFFFLFLTASVWLQEQAPSFLIYVYWDDLMFIVMIYVYCDDSVFIVMIYVYWDDLMFIVMITVYCDDSMFIVMIYVYWDDLMFSLVCFSHLQKEKVEKVLSHSMCVPHEIFSNLCPHYSPVSVLFTLVVLVWCIVLMLTKICLSFPSPAHVCLRHFD